MSICFGKDLDALLALLALGGYTVRATRTIPGGRGRSADVYLSNGVIICWDDVSRKIWIDRFSRRGVQVEKFLQKMCEGPRLLRALAIARARVSSGIESLHTASAAWLLRSEGHIARTLRRQISRA